MEQCFQANKEIEELQKLQLRKHHKTTDKYQNVSAKVMTSFREKKKQESENSESVPKSNIESALNDKAENGERKNEINVVESDKKQITKKIFRPEIGNTVIGKQKRQSRTSKHRNEQKLQSQVSPEPSVLPKSDKTANHTDTLNIVKYRNQGIQTLDTDEVESIYSEGIIR